MKKFYMILAALLIGSVCFAQKAQVLRETHPVNIPNSSLRATGWYGNSDFDIYWPFEAGEYLILRPETFAGATTAGEQVTKVKFYTYQDASNYAAYTSMSFTIKIYQGSTMTDDLINSGYASDNDAALGNLAYTQNYTATSYGLQEVVLGTPYTITSANYWVVLQCNGKSLLVGTREQISTAVSVEQYQADEAEPEMYISDFSDAQYLYYENDDYEDIDVFFVLTYSTYPTDIAYFYNYPYFLVYVQGSGAYVENSDIVAGFMAAETAPYYDANENITISATDDLSIYPYMMNNGPDATSNDVEVSITMNGTEVISHTFPMSGTNALAANSFIFLNGYQDEDDNTITHHDLTFSADEMDELGFTGTFDVCLTCTYAGVDNNSSNNTTCLHVTREGTSTPTTSSDLAAKLYTDTNLTTEIASTITLSATDNFSAVAAIKNYGPDDATTGIVTISISKDGTIMQQQPLPLSQLPLPNGETTAIANIGLTAEQMDQNGFTGTFEICFDISYANDPNTNNNSKCVTVTRNSSTPTTYTITAVANNNAYGTVTGGGTYEEGATAHLTATANNGYRFVSWNDGNSENPRDVVVTGNATYTAMFEANAATTYTITAVANNNAYGTVTGGGTYEEGATAHLTATANNGYRFVSWNDGNTENPRDVVVTGNATYTAMFEANASATTYTITAIANNNAYGTVSGGGTYQEGETVTLTATPNSGYVFTSWNNGSTANPLIFTATENITYIATFENENNVTMYTITVESNNNQMGTVTGGGRFAAGTTITIEAHPNEHYRFVNWQDGNTDNPREITVNSNATYRASFEDIPQYTITATAGLGGTINPNGTVTVYEGDDKDFTITANEGYRITSVIVDNVESYSLLQNTTDTLTYRIAGVYTFANITRTHTISVSFEVIPTVTLTVNAEDPTMGTVAGSGTYYKGASVRISATENDGYVFSKWNDDDRHNPRTVVVNADATYTATFVDATTVQLYTITVRANNDTYGTVEGGGRYAEGTIITISATANNGYEFTEWNDHNTDNPREIEVTANATYIATFNVAGAVEEMVVTEIDIYPNPASDVLNITSSENISRIEIISSTGRIIVQQDVNSDYATFNVSDLSNGMYFVRIFGSEQNSVFVRKFIKD